MFQRLKINESIALQDNNDYRKMHGVPNMKWSNVLQYEAQIWADIMADNDFFEHSPYKNGENIAMMRFKRGVTYGELYFSTANALFYKEGKGYNYSNGSAGRASHFTQLVWKSSYFFGVGVSRSNQTNRVYVVVEYYPPGNKPGLFMHNVLKPKL